MFLLYSNENYIAKKANEIINNYKNSNREKLKKKFELFHLLVFLEKANLKNLKIIPNEPGDFIIKNENEKYVIEVTSVFGNKDENIKMKSILNKIFGVSEESKNENEISFDNEVMKKIFLKKITEKEKKDYISSQKATKSFLLIVTGEFNNCSITGSWFLKFLRKEELLFKKSFDKVWILDYFASGKDNGPIIIKDFYNEFIEYKNIYSKK